VSARVRERRASGRGVCGGAAVAMGSGRRGEASAEVGELGLLRVSLQSLASRFLLSRLPYPPPFSSPLSSPTPLLFPRPSLASRAPPLLSFPLFSFSFSCLSLPLRSLALLFHSPLSLLSAPFSPSSRPSHSALSPYPSLSSLLLLTSLSEVARGACAERRARRRGAGAGRAVEGERASERKRRRISGE